MARKNDYHMQQFYNQLMKGRPMLYKYQFVIEFIQGGTFNYGDKQQYAFNLFPNDPNQPDQNFTYYAQSAKLPSYEIVKAEIPYYGTKFRPPTVIKYEHDFNVKVLLEQDMIMYEKFREWQRLISSLRLSGGGSKTIPNINMRISLLDASHTYFTTSYVLCGVWPTEVPELKFEYKGDDNTAMTCDIKFKYQYCYRDDSFTTADDPLTPVNNMLK